MRTPESRSSQHVITANHLQHLSAKISDQDQFLYSGEILFGQGTAGGTRWTQWTRCSGTPSSKSRRDVRPGGQWARKAYTPAPLVGEQHQRSAPEQEPPPSRGKEAHVPRGKPEAALGGREDRKRIPPPYPPDTNTPPVGSASTSAAAGGVCRPLRFPGVDPRGKQERQTAAHSPGGG